MTVTAEPKWESKRTDESRLVEKVLQQAGFPQADAYRYNSASIRVRVIDSRFKGLSTEQRHAMVEPYLESLPEEIQADIMNLFTFSPEEIKDPTASFRHFFQNEEFEDPSPSIL